MLVNFGGAQLSCSDSARSSLMIFLRGCFYDCYYCQNKDLKSGENLVEIEEIEQVIKDSSSLISEVIFSGGEAMFQPKVVRELAVFSRSLYLKVGLETSGYDSLEIYKLLKLDLLDEIFLDVKNYGQDNYLDLTGSGLAWDHVLKVIHICNHFNIPLELRTTIFKNYPTEEDLEQIERLAQSYNLPWKKQEGRLN